MQHVIVSAPELFGGNHLTNLLSLSPIFEPIWAHDGTSSEYGQKMLYRYNAIINNRRNNIHVSPSTFNVHLGTNNTMPDLMMLLSSGVNQSKRRLFFSHSSLWLGQLYGYPELQFPIIGHEKTFKYIIMGQAASDNLVHTRRFWAHRNSRLMRIPVAPLPPNFHTLNIGITGNPELEIQLSGDKFWSTEGFDYLNSVFNKEFNTDLPVIGRELHKVWYDYITYSCMLASQTQDARSLGSS